MNESGERPIVLILKYSILVKDQDGRLMTKPSQFTELLKTKTGQTPQQYKNTN